MIKTLPGHMHREAKWINTIIILGEHKENSAF